MLCVITDFKVLQTLCLDNGVMFVWNFVTTCCCSGKEAQKLADNMGAKKNLFFLMDSRLTLKCFIHIFLRDLSQLLLFCFVKSWLTDGQLINVYFHKAKY